MEHTSWPFCISYFKLMLEKSARLWSPARPPQTKSESGSRTRGQTEIGYHRRLKKCCFSFWWVISASEENPKYPLKRLKRRYFTRIKCFTFYDLWFFYVSVINSDVEMYLCHISIFVMGVISHSSYKEMSWPWSGGGMAKCRTIFQPW